MRLPSSKQRLPHSKNTPNDSELGLHCSGRSARPGHAGGKAIASLESAADVPPPTGVLKGTPFDLEVIGFGRPHTAPRAKIERRNQTLPKTDLKILQNKFSNVEGNRPMTIIDKRRGAGAASDMAQQAAQRGFDTLVPDHVKTGAKLTGIVIDAAKSLTVSIPHKLGRVPVGWQKMRASGSGQGADLVETAADKNTITLRRPTGSTGTLTFDIWVF